LHFLLLILFGVLSGIFAGMGMGGGTFLVPLLSIVFGTEQLICQSTNVICFLVLAVVCTVIYTKNKLINFWVVLCVCIPSILVSVLCSLLTLKVESKLLHIIFAGFIILIGVYFLISSIVEMVKKKR
jgi:uncharacterized membrane protein YfcA